MTGAGDRAFCAGADLKAIAAGEMLQTPQMERRGFAGLFCDLIVASENATFGLPEVRRGLMAAGGGSLRLPRQIPLKVAMQLILTGDR